MRIRTDKSQFEMKDEEAEENKEKIDTEVTTINVQDDAMEEETQKQPVTDEEEMYEFKDDDQGSEPLKTKRKHESSEAVVPSESPEIPGSNEMAVDTTGSQRSQESETDLGVRCPCGVNEDDGLMILCAVCKYWQHGICFLIKDEEEAPQSHFCDVCADVNSSEKHPTDPYLSALSSVAIQATCLWRRTLFAIPELNRILAPNLSKRLGVEVSVAQGLMNRLEKEGFIKSSGKNRKLGKIVDKEKLKIEGYKKYLVRKPLEKTTMDDTGNEADMEFKKPLQQKDLNNSIEQLTALTEDIELSRPKKKGKRNKKVKENKKIEEVTLSPSKATEENKTKKNRKRAISKVDETEFDVTDSQMDSQDFLDERGTLKKKKASIVSKAIMV